MSNGRKRLPGSEKLTRPEDIDALSKYLGDIKKTQEEHTVLDTDNLEVPGRTTGRIPEINDLPEGKELLDNTSEDVKLGQERIGLDAEENPNLSDYIETLDAENEVGLSTNRLDLEDTRNLPLDTRRDNLDISEKELELDESKVELEATDPIISLGENRLELEVNEDLILSNYKEDLDGVNQDNSLDENRIELEVNEDLSLENKRLGIEGETEDLILSNHKEELDGVVSDSSLTETRIDLDGVNQDNSLDENRIELEVNQDTSLDENRIELEVNEENISLLTKATLLNDVPEVSINIQEGASGEIETTLDDTKVELTSDEGESKTDSLDETKIGLEASDENTLNETRIDIKDDSEPKLDDSKVDLNVEDEIELGEESIKLAGEINDSELDQTIIKPGEEAVDLSGLEDTRVDLNTSQDIELEDEKLELIDIPETPLDNTKISRGGKDEELDLSDFIDSLDDEREPELSDKRLDIEEKEVSDLYDSVISGPTPEEVELGETKIELDATDLKELEDEKLKLEDVEGVEELYDSVISTPLNPDHEGWSKKELYDSIMTAPEDQKYEKAIQMAQSLGPWGMKVASLISSVLSNDSVNAETATWFDSELKKILRQMGAMAEFNFERSGERAQEMNGENAELNGSSSRKYLPQRTGEDSTFNEALETTKDPEFLIHYAQGQGISRPVGLDENENGINDKEEAAEEAFTASDKPNFIYGKWGIGGDNRNSGYRTIPKYQLPSRGILDALNVSNYIRFGVEELFSLWDPHTKAERVLKPMLVNEALALLIIAREQLEKLTKGNRERLPGDDMGLISDVMSGGVSGAIDNLKDNAMSALQNTFSGVDGVEKKNPLNRPRTKLKSNDGVVTWVKEVTKGFDKGNVRQDPPSDGSMDWKNLGKNLGKNLVDALIGGLGDMNKTRELDFVHKDGDKAGDSVVGKGKGLGYIDNPAMIMTLMELCELTDPLKVDSLEALKEVLKSSPYITTPTKFGTIEGDRYGTMTLDTNSYWEVVIEPFCHTSMNGGFSFLPAIEEINVLNKANFGVTTKYSKWLPIMNFELQKSKLTNKSLGLYDGEIVYPVTSELSNELRMTLADDQYKSWRTYFQKCADVSVYSSEAHPLEYYVTATGNSEISGAEGLAQAKAKGLSSWSTLGSYSEKPHITVVDKTRPLVALYKNITFLIKIYIMTPQYSTIRKFNLLCVLKDFEESYSGDIDAGGYDLNLSFSIVGENPPSDKAGAFVKKENKKSLSDILGGKEPDLLNQTPKKKGGIIKLL